MSSRLARAWPAIAATLRSMWFIIIPIVGTESNEIDLAMILHVVSLLILTVFIIEVYILIKIKWSLSYPVLYQ